MGRREKKGTQTKTAPKKALELEKKQLLENYRWLRKMADFLNWQSEMLDRQLVELERLLPDDCV
jgi:hypothetical protein